MTTIGTVRDWYCPACGLTDQTREPRPHTQYHVCPKSRMLSIAMLPAGVRARIVVHEREDYVGNEQVRLAEGRPVMSVETQRPDGSNDVAVFAPTATARGEV
jgi:hypothetical protein